MSSIPELEKFAPLFSRPIFPVACTKNSCQDVTGQARVATTKSGPTISRDEARHIINNNNNTMSSSPPCPPTMNVVPYIPPPINNNGRPSLLNTRKKIQKRNIPPNTITCVQVKSLGNTCSKGITVCAACGMFENEKFSNRWLRYLKDNNPSSPPCSPAATAINVKPYFPKPVTTSCTYMGSRNHITLGI